MFRIWSRDDEVLQIPLVDVQFRELAASVFHYWAKAGK